MAMGRRVKKGLVSLLTAGMIAGAITGCNKSSSTGKQLQTVSTTARPSKAQYSKASQAPENTNNNLIPNSSLEKSADGTSPENWVAGNWGNNKTQFEYVQNDGHSGSKSAKLTVSNYKRGDAKWYFNPITNIERGSEYEFSDWYKTNSQPHVVVKYTGKDANEHYFSLNDPPSGSKGQKWHHYKDHFTLPKDAKDMTVFMLLSGNGWLEVDDYALALHPPVGFNKPIVSLTFDDGWKSTYENGLPLLDEHGFKSTMYIISGKVNTPGYMTDNDIAKLIKDGQEIGSHTISHPHLTKLSNSDLEHELKDSKEALQSKFGSSVANDFASPYGEYNNHVIEQIAKYYSSHRSTVSGFNEKDGFDPYHIVVQNVDGSTTPKQVDSWVDYAKKTKTWLVLVYHQVTSDDNVPKYGVSASNLKKELDHIDNSGIPVKTINQALNYIQHE